MGNQLPATPTGPAEGDVRFDDSGRLEFFDGTAWVPLQRLSDVELPPVFRHGQSSQPSAQSEPDGAEGPVSS